MYNYNILVYYKYDNEKKEGVFVRALGGGSHTRAFSTQKGTRNISICKIHDKRFLYLINLR